MTRHHKAKLALFALLLSVFASANAATTPPKVVFIGDWVTDSWTSAFAANPNWINEGTPGIGLLGQGSSSATLARFQADVVNLHPAIVHIMIGSSDADEDDDASFQLTLPYFLNNLDTMVKEAKAANIKVILGIEPSTLSFDSSILEQLNSVVANYGAANSIPVINYEGALCGYVCSGDGTAVGYSWTGDSSLLVTSAESGGLIPSAVGYSVMTQMAEATINTLDLTLKGGWLQNVQQFNGNEDSGPTPDVNTVQPGAVLQFTPTGLYSDGSQQVLLNTNLQGSNGIWTSSDPLVMYVNQSGMTWAISQGTAIIRYLPPSGIKFSEWIMYVKSAAP
jgi:lysophospholipase L1-like esterase